jgi:hypothetical protein
MRRTVVLYERQDCGLCEEAAQLLEALAPGLGLDLVRVDIDHDVSLRARFGEAVPVVELDGRELIRAPIDGDILQRALSAAVR